MPTSAPKAWLALAWAALLALTVAACAKTEVGTASVATTGVAAGDTAPTTGSTSSASTSSRPSASSPSLTVEQPTLNTADLPSFPDDTAMPSFDMSGFSADLPADWPADLKLPDGASIFGATSEKGVSIVLFQAGGSVADTAAFFDAEIKAMGYEVVSTTDMSGTVSNIYRKGTSTIGVGLTDLGGQATGSIQIQSS